MADAPTASPAPTVSVAPPRSALGEVLLWLLLVLLTFSLPKPPSAELDASWRLGLTYFLEHGYAFGRDIVFTYGPLGFLLGRTYSGVYLWALISWQVVQAVVAATLLWRLSRPLHGTSRFFYFAFFLLFGVGYEDALQMILIALLGWAMLRRLSEEKSRVLVVPSGAFLAVLAAIKFTNLVLAGFVVVVVAVYAMMRKRRSAAWWLAGAFAGGFALVWVLCGEPVRAFPAYVWNSFDVSAGYEASMGLPTPAAPFWKACGIFLLLAGYVVWHLRTQPDRIRSAASFAILAAFLYLNWKHGFVRADGHMLGFFYSALLVCLGFPALFGERGPSVWIGRLLVVPAALLAIWGVHDALPSVVEWAGNITNEKIVHNLRAVTDWPGTRQDLDNQLTLQRATVDLPKTRAVVAKATIDVLGYEQGVAILNRFNYTPRPVFQSYSAYTPHLAQLNADFYESRRAPEYALFKLQTIDERPPMLDDARLLQIFPHEYRFVLNEKGYQLWRRRDTLPAADQLAPRPLTRRAVTLGRSEPLGEYEHQPLWVTIDVRPTLLGRLRNFLYKPALVQLRLTDVEGGREVYRLPLMAARGGFLLNPIVTDLESYIESQGGHPKRWVQSLELTVDPGDRACFDPTAQVTLFAVTPANAKAEYEQQLVRARYSMFSLVPDEVNAFAPPSQIEIDGHQALVAHAPSVMVFTLPPGAKRITGLFGYPPGAYSNGGNTDGAEFRVVWVGEAEQRVLFSQLIRPKQEPKDRGLHPFDVDLSQLPAGGKLHLEVSPGPQDDHSWDWTAWSDVVIQ